MLIQVFLNEEQLSNTFILLTLNGTRDQSKLAGYYVVVECSNSLSPLATFLNVVNNFISVPDASLLCSICLELASQPKQCEDCGKCSVVSGLRRMRGNLVQLLGLTIPDTSRMSEVTFEPDGLTSEGHIAEDPIKLDQRIM